MCPEVLIYMVILCGMKWANIQYHTSDSKKVNLEIFLGNFLGEKGCGIREKGGKTGRGREKGLFFHTVRGGGRIGVTPPSPLLNTERIKTIYFKIQYNTDTTQKEREYTHIEVSL